MADEKLFLSVTDYAAHRRARGLRGCSRKAVYAALSKDWIVRESDGLIEAHAADRAWAAHTQAPSEPEGHVRMPNGDVLDMKQERALKIHQERIKLELQNKKTRGELIERDLVCAHWADVATTIREQILAIPDRLAAQVVAIDNGHAARELLKVELSHALTRLADDLDEKYSATDG